MPLNTKIGEPVKYVKDKETICLDDDQAIHIYKKVDSESIVNIDTIKQEIEDKLCRNNIDHDKANPYHEILTNNIDKVNIITLQMKQWSVLCNVVKYVPYDRYPKHLDVKTIDQNVIGKYMMDSW